LADACGHNNPELSSWRVHERRLRSVLEGW